ncbi:MAG: hypothetical protein IEMM0008_0092 [bacterium]|nr:MAG: hypothetical protein IEMM0008_0092 [bacterium]
MGKLTGIEWDELCDTVLSEGDEVKTLLAKEHGVTVQSVNAQLRKRGHRQRRERSDKRKRKISNQAYKELVILSTTRKRTAEDTIKDFIFHHPEHGRIKDGQIMESLIHPATLSRWLREDDLNKQSKLKKGAFRMVADRPLHVLQWDSTRATQWYVDHEEDGNIVIGFVSHLSENKSRSNHKSKLTFMAFQDMFSRKVWFKVVTHENAVTWLEFFYEVAIEMGLPENIYSDNASMFSRAGKVRTVLGTLDVKFQSHLPGNSKAKGMIEKTIQKLEMGARVTLIEKAKTLEQYNEILSYLAKEYNHRVHSTTGMTPDQMFYSHYSMITKREAPSYTDFKRIAPRWDERVLKTNLSVEWGGKAYQCREQRKILADYVGKKVRVEEHPKRPDVIYIVLEGREIEAFDIKLHGEITKTFGDYKDLPLSKKERFLKEIDDFKADSKAKGEDVVSASYKRRFEESFTEYEARPKDIIPFNQALIERKGELLDFDEAKIYCASHGINVSSVIPILVNLFGERETVYESELDPLIRQEQIKQA